MKPAPLKGRTWNPYTIPDVIDPGGVRCIKVYIPDSLQWLQIFAAVMDTMCHWKNYELLGDTSAAQCAALMRSIMQQYNTFAYCDDCDPSSIIDEMEYQMAVCEQLRFQNGKLQGLCCGVWSDITGQPAQGFQAAPLGSGATQPAPQGCVTYNASFSAQSVWLLPYPVNTGDTILVSNAKGASYNSTNTQWQCPDGLLFFAGACVGTAILNGSNPMPAIASGRLIAKIGATFYDVMAGSPFTVPSGHSNATVTFQVNYPTLASSGGDLTFDVTVCNQAAATWTKVFDFTQSPYTSVWTPGTAGSPLVNQAIWVPGVGYQSQLWKFATNWFRGTVILHNKTYNQTSLIAEFAFTPGTYAGNTTDITYLQLVQPGAVRVNEVKMPNTPTSPKTDVANRSVTQEYVALGTGFSNVSADPGGQATLTKVTITGTGTNPF